MSHSLLVVSCLVSCVSCLMSNVAFNPRCPFICYVRARPGTTTEANCTYTSLAQDLSTKYRCTDMIRESGSHGQLPIVSGTRSSAVRLPGWTVNIETSCKKPKAVL